MRHVPALVALLTLSGTIAASAHAGSRAQAWDLQTQVSGSYGSEALREAALRASTRERRARPTAEQRRESPWGPFAGPPGLF